MLALPSFGLYYYKKKTLTRQQPEYMELFGSLPLMTVRRHIYCVCLRHRQQGGTTCIALQNIRLH